MRCKADYRPTPCLSVSLTDLPHLLVRQIWNVKPSFKTGDFQGSDGQKPASKSHSDQGHLMFLADEKSQKEPIEECGGGNPSFLIKMLKNT